MLLYGASGHSKVICSILEENGIPVLGLFDDNSTINTLRGYVVLGKYDKTIFPNEKMIVSIGDNRIRKRLVGLVSHSFGSCFSASAFCDPSSNLGSGSVVMPGSIIQPNSIVGNHVIVNTSSSIDHDCIIEDFVHISPGATLCGSVRVGEGTHIGAGATVIQNINIGKWCIIGAGAVVLKDIPDFAIVVGNPARIIKTQKLNE